MNGKLMAGLALGFCLGVATVATWAWQPAPAHGRDAAPRWEYKAVVFVSHRTDAEYTRHLNQLAEDGWEYAGQIVNSTTPGVQLPSVVAFKRPKK
jgi:hypothetical protein